MEFNEIDFSWRKLVDKYTEHYGENSCQHSFPAMYCLQNKYGDSLCERDGYLFVLRSRKTTNTYRTYLMPMGGGDLAHAMDLLTADAAEHDAYIRFETVTKSEMLQLTGMYPDRFIITEDRALSEYIYSCEQIATLAGSGLKQNRQKCNAFWRILGDRAVFSPIELSDFSEIRAFQKTWVELKRESKSYENLMLENEAIEKAIANFDALGLMGLVLRIDGVVSGYAYGCRLSSNCADMLVAKVDYTFPGVSIALSQAFAAHCLKQGYQYVNWEEDLGYAGLRQFKMSFRPDNLLQKYILSEAVYR